MSRLCKLQVRTGGTWVDHEPPVQGAYSFCLGWKKCLLATLATLSRIVPVARPTISPAVECSGFNPEEAAS